MEQPLSPREILVYKQRLLDMGASLADEVEHVEAHTLAPSGEPPFLRDDEAAEETLLDDQLGSLAVEDELGYAVHRALDRIRAGTYGICVHCNQIIARERLDLLPYVVECAQCARDRLMRQPETGAPDAKTPRTPPRRG